MATQATRLEIDHPLVQAAKRQPAAERLIDRRPSGAEPNAARRDRPRNAPRRRPCKPPTRVDTTTRRIGAILSRIDRKTRCVVARMLDRAATCLDIAVLFGFEHKATRLGTASIDRRKTRLDRAASHHRAATRTRRDERVACRIADGIAMSSSIASFARDLRMIERHDGCCNGAITRRHSTRRTIVRRREAIGDRRVWLARLGRVRRPRRRLGEIGSLDAAKRGFSRLFALRNAIEGRSFLDRGDRLDERSEHATAIGDMGSAIDLGGRASGRSSRPDRPPSSWLRDWLPVRWHRRRRGRDAIPRRPRSPPRGERDLRRLRRLRRLAGSRDVGDGQVRKRFGTHDAPAADAGLAGPFGAPMPLKAPAIRPRCSVLVRVWIDPGPSTGQRRFLARSPSPAGSVLHISGSRHRGNRRPPTRSKPQREDTPRFRDQRDALGPRNPLPDPSCPRQRASERRRGPRVSVSPCLCVSQPSGFGSTGEGRDAHAQRLCASADTRSSANVAVRDHFMLASGVARLQGLPRPHTSTSRDSADER